MTQVKGNDLIHKVALWTAGLLVAALAYQYQTDRQDQKEHNREQSHESRDILIAVGQTSTQLERLTTQAEATKQAVNEIKAGQREHERSGAHPRAEAVLQEYRYRIGQLEEAAKNK